MKNTLFLALFAPIVLSAQGGRGGRNGGGAGFGGLAATSMAPQQVFAADVPVLEGVPHAVKVGLTVYVSGMVPLDSTGRLVGQGDLGRQIRQALGNLGSVMRAAKGVPGDVARLTVYVRDLTADKMAIVRREVVDGSDRLTPPALTVVGVSSLAEPGVEVTIDAIGQLRSEYPDKSRLSKPE